MSKNLRPTLRERQEVMQKIIDKHPKTRPLAGYPVLDGRSWHQNECHFPKLKVCTCGLLHTAARWDVRDDWFKSEWKEQDVRLEQIERLER